MAKRKKYLTIKEKMQLASEGKPVPLCVYPDEKERKRRKNEQKKLFKRFSKFIKM